MSTTPRASRNILIASDNAIDAELVKSLLDETFDNVFTSTEAGRAVADFARHVPQVLVLAFNTLEKSERYCLRLNGLNSRIHAQPRRTIILCDKDEVGQVSELCVKHSFDDYVLFWPMNHDAARLRMAVHNALRQLAPAGDAGVAVAEFAAQARRLAELESLLDQETAADGRRIDSAGLAMARAEREIGEALDGFARRLCEGALQNAVEVTDAAALEREMDRFKREEIQRCFRPPLESVPALKRLLDEFSQGCAPSPAPSRAPSPEPAPAADAGADHLRPLVLVVDDDDFQRKMVARLLPAENYRLAFAASGAEALNILRETRPDLILMDVQMPDMDGIEVTRRLKSMPRFATVPIVMITGKSEGNVVVESLRAGAADFVVKPLERDKLLAKVARWSRTKAAPAVQSIAA